MRNALLLACSLLAVTLAGCSESSPADTADDDGTPEVEATSTTGGIRGVVVDQAIVPVEGATVRILDTQQTTETDDQGAFVFSGLEPGTYFVEATHPFYDTQQTSTVVEAGVSAPPAVKIQLTRIITQDPFMVPYTFQGFISCSANLVIGLSEECGEGVGIPRDSCFITNHPPQCVDNPVMPGERVAKNPTNKAGQEWFVDAPDMKTFVVEQVWTPSLEVSATGGGQFRTFITENWVCDPFCGEDYEFADVTSNSPLVRQIELEDHSGFTYNATTRFTTFTYAADNPGLLLEQGYELFVHTFHVLPAPEGWALTNDDENPF